MKIFLTGGAGFIGSHIADALAADWHKVIIYDNFSSGYRENLAAVERKIKIIEGDILDTKKLFRSCPEDVDLISHQAAQLEIFKCLADPGIDLATNTQGTVNILELARRKKILKVINASSACVYGQAQTMLQTETHPTSPNWPYGVSKLSAEHYARIYGETYGVQTVNLRYGIVYGPREWYGRVLTMFLSRMYQGKPPVVFGDGSQLRDFTSVFDAVDFNMRCLGNEAVWGKSFNVSTGIGTSVRELAELTCRVLAGGARKPLFEQVSEGAYSVNMPTRRRIPQELKAMVLSCELARVTTGYTPRVSLAAGIQQEYDWFCKNPHRWDMKSKVKV